MIGKVFHVILVLAVCSAGGNNLKDDLKTEIVMAQNKIYASKEASTEEILTFRQRFAEVFDYFDHSKKEYERNIEKKFQSSQQQMEDKEDFFVVEAIDKKKGYNTFTCIAKAAAETQDALSNGIQAYKKCTEAAYRSSERPLVGCSGQINLIEPAVNVALYDPLLKAVSECKNKECIKNVLNKSNAREANLHGVIQGHKDKAGEIRSQFGQGMVTCNRNAQGHFDNAIRNCESKMKGC